VDRPTLLDVVRAGSHRESLEALRDYLADALDATDSPRDQAPLANRLQAVLAELSEMKEDDDDGTGDLFFGPEDQAGT
jgi:hypothetical protein